MEIQIGVAGFGSCWCVGFRNEAKVGRFFDPSPSSYALWSCSVYVLLMLQVLVSSFSIFVEGNGKKTSHTFRLKVASRCDLWGQNFIDHEKSGLFPHASKLKTKTRCNKIVIFSIQIFFPSLSSHQHP